MSTVPRVLQQGLLISSSPCSHATHFYDITAWHLISLSHIKNDAVREGSIIFAMYIYCTLVGSPIEDSLNIGHASQNLFPLGEFEAGVLGSHTPLPISLLRLLTPRLGFGPGMSGCQALNVVGLVLGGLDPIQEQWCIFFAGSTPRPADSRKFQHMSVANTTLLHLRSLWLYAMHCPLHRHHKQRILHVMGVEFKE